MGRKLDGLFAEGCPCSLLRTVDGLFPFSFLVVVILAIRVVRAVVLITLFSHESPRRLIGLPLTQSTDSFIHSFIHPILLTCLGVLG